MAFWDGMYKELADSGLFSQSQEQKEKIEGVLFDIWMKGQLERTPLASFGIIILSRTIGLFVSLFTLPYLLVKHIPVIIFSFITSTALYFIWLSFELSLSAFLLTLAFLNREKAIEVIRDFSYDIADAVSLGALTRRKVRILQSTGSTRLFKGDSFLIHLFTSRVLSSGEHCREADAFQEIVKRYKNDWPALEKLIMNYWSTDRKDVFYWRDKLKYT